MFDFAANFQQFLTTLPIMGKGMLGIFAVILVIYLVTLVLGKMSDESGGASN
ncbi:hypothetical protein [Feifania hominis]|uniref:Uncharacterized protein n=1 Tax=Feifania hominis TaxID=2763660 RepID=A0A926DG39_9FIRM|nr:hypothetical protein [Feifania hominis]MBC8537221.1 hypothetical protein [Feifania hominis]